MGAMAIQNQTILGDKMTTEKVPILLIYLQNSQIHADRAEETSLFELYGFLKLYIKRLGKLLENQIEEK